MFVLCVTYFVTLIWMFLSYIYMGKKSILIRIVYHPVCHIFGSYVDLIVGLENGWLGCSCDHHSICVTSVVVGSFGIWPLCFLVRNELIFCKVSFVAEHTFREWCWHSGWHVPVCFDSVKWLYFTCVGIIDAQATIILVSQLSVQQNI